MYFQEPLKAFQEKAHFEKGINLKFMYYLKLATGSTCLSPGDLSDSTRLSLQVVLVNMFLLPLAVQQAIYRKVAPWLRPVKTECAYTWDFSGCEGTHITATLKEHLFPGDWCCSFQMCRSLNVTNGQGQIGQRHFYEQQLFEDKKLLDWSVQLMKSLFGP